ncbi:MAG TPA: FHA domain-containing protein, partial [Kofleriaceae bacterium]|nr:FHA domain-containing protein [Kofleriaceae bacterium]
MTVASLVYADADGIERSLTIGAEPVLVGRATECAIRSSDPRVSRNHARFYLDHTGTLHVEDLGSSNGVYVGPHKVQHCAVPMNELVFVGSLVFRMVAPPAPPMQAAEWAQPATQPATPQWQPVQTHEPTVSWQPPQPAPVFTPPPAPLPAAP